jgi:dipeptidyl-peptidase-4
MKAAKVLPLFLICLFLSSLNTVGAQPSTTAVTQDITLENIWKNFSFGTRSVPGFNFMNDGKHYTRRQGDAIVMHDLTSGEQVEEIFKGESLKSSTYSGTMSSYTFSEDESKIMIKSESEQIYRRSSRAYFHVYDRKTKAITPIYADDKIQYATFSPDATKVAYVWNNDLYWFDIASGETSPITTDGEKNAIINGSTDWVYEEEFAFVKAFNWSPDSKKVAFIRFDETEVPEFTMTLNKGELYPEYETWKYPKVGSKNADVSVHIYNLDSDKTMPVQMGDMTEMYVPRIKWTQDADKLCVFKMNRHQSHLELLLAGAKNGNTTTLLTEKNKYYIDITDNLTFLKNGKEFIWTSEKDGYNHIYLYDMKGRVKKQLTKGNYDVRSFYGVDEKNKRVFYQASEQSALVKNVYSVGLNGKKKKKLSKENGTSSAQFSSTYDYNVITHSDINTASSYKVFDRSGKLIRVIEDNARSAKLQAQHGTAPMEFFNFQTSEGVKLNGWMIKPRNFDASKQYPVFMTQYSGPGSQQVTDSWKGTNYWWYQMLAQKGFIVACVDPRGTGGRGEEFKKMTYLELGKFETIDQIEAAKYLGSLPYTDKEKIGIFGWSYGGYMSSLAILKGNDTFKAAIAVAPVTSWKWYDTIYTERYMRTLKENESGYNDNSPIYFADRLRGNYLLVHGDADDNVHFQHTAEMTNALISANKQFDTYFYPNRNHGIYGDNARLHLYTKMTNFLEEKLKGGEWNSGEPSSDEDRL